MRLMQGDCLELMKDIPDESVDAVSITTERTIPPRGTGKEESRGAPFDGGSKAWQKMTTA